MKKTLLFLCLTILSAHTALSQCVYTCSNYAVSQITYTTFPSGPTNVTPTFTNTFISGPSTDDGSTGPIPIGFSFDFFCNAYSNIYICSNGFITFDYQPFAWPTQYVHPTQNLPDPADPNGMIAFNMTDLDPTLSGTITYTTIGTAPNRKFIVTYNNVPCFSTPADLNNGQIVLFETSNIIEIHTGSAKPDINQLALGSTQGIENTNSSAFAVPPGRNANNSWGASANNTAYQFSPYSITPPTSITGNTVLCQGTGGAYSTNFIAGASYNWSLPSGWSGTSTISTINATSGSSGTFSVSATYTCGTSTPVVLTVSVTPAPTVAITSIVPNIVCSGKTVTINGSGALNYTLNPTGLIGIPPFIDLALSNVTYTLVGEDANGCLSFNNATMVLAVLPSPTITVNSGEVCLGSTFTISPAGTTSYVVTGGFFQVTPTVGVHTYSLTGIAGNGCVSEKVVSTVTVNPLPTINVTASRTVMCTKESVSLSATGGTSYVWSNQATSASITVSPVTPTFYIATGTDNKGCQNTGSVVIQVKPCTGISEMNNQETNVSIYPNPTRGEFEVQLKSVNESAMIEIYNGLGQLLLKEKMTSEKMNVNLKTYNSGLYYVKIKNNNEEKIIKLVKE